MFVTITTILISIVKWFFEKKAKKKLTDVEFLNHIEAHQKRRAGVGSQATKFEDSMAKAYSEMQLEEKDEK